MCCILTAAPWGLSTTRSTPRCIVAWAIADPPGGAEQVVLSDYRLILGLERKVAGGLSSRVEVGYVFGRRIQYSSGTPDFYPTDTVMLRGGLTY